MTGRDEFDDGQALLGLAFALLLSLPVWVAILWGFRRVLS